MTQALPQWVPWTDSAGRPTAPFLTYMLQHDQIATANTASISAVQRAANTLAQTVANLPAAGSAQWGAIVGILSQQIDLQAALDTKLTHGQTMARVSLGW